MPFGKVAVAVLLLALVAGGGFLFNQGSAPLQTAQLQQDQSVPRRGDDPTYAEELKTMTALLQQMRYEMKQMEGERERERDQSESRIEAEIKRAISHSQNEIDRLKQALSEAQDTLN
ncbi:MAG: hypothetical protein GY947_23425, partial [Rhodobacteraceae bacterium]|nr:hypothetical protein [Paracoccaceae bacterium]